MMNSHGNSCRLIRSMKLVSQSSCRNHDALYEREQSVLFQTPSNMLEYELLSGFGRLDGMMNDIVSSFEGFMAEISGMFLKFLLWRR